MAATLTRGMRMAAIDGCDRDAWQPKTAADGDTERADAKRDATGTGGRWAAIHGC